VKVPPVSTPIRTSSFMVEDVLEIYLFMSGLKSRITFDASLSNNYSINR